MLRCWPIFDRRTKPGDAGRPPIGREVRAGATCEPSRGDPAHYPGAHPGVPIAVLLLDNSAWSHMAQDCLGEDRLQQVAEWMADGEIATCLPFLLEAGYSARSAAGHHAMMTGLARLPRIQITVEIEQRTLSAQHELALADATPDDRPADPAPPSSADPTPPPPSPAHPRHPTGAATTSPSPTTPAGSTGGPSPTYSTPRNPHHTRFDHRARPTTRKTTPPARASTAPPHRTSPPEQTE
jgi:hypothetical protein